MRDTLRMSTEVQAATPKKTRRKKKTKRTYVAADVLPTTGLIRLPTILKFIGISKATFYNGIASGKYPKPLRHMGPRISCWKAEDIWRLINGGAA